MEYVVYHATWCPFCLAFMEFYKEIIPDGKDIILDSDSDPLWVEKDLEYVPTVIAVDDGNEVKRLMAEPGKGITRDMLEEWISS